jgi:glyoxylate carboligase
MTTTKGTQVITIQIPNNYIDYCADASIGDTLGWLDMYGEHYGKCKDPERNIAWLEACKQMNRHDLRRKHFTEITVSVLAAQVIADDMNYFATRDLGGYDPLDKPNLRRYAKQCAKARTRILDQIAGA